MNIVCDGATLRPIKQESGKAYSLDDIIFFVAKKYVNHKFYLVVTDGKKYDAVELKPTNSTNKDYYNFVANAADPLKIVSGNCDMSIIGFSNGDTTPDVITDKVSIKFDNTAYNFKAQISIIEQFSRVSADIYNKMLDVYNKFYELSKLNAELLEEESEVTE